MEPGTYNILLIDDDEDECVLLKRMFAEINTAEFHLDWVATYEEGLIALAENRHDAYLLDYRLGERDGVELLREAAASDCDATIIMLTSHNDFSVDSDAMKLGCADFLIKGQINRDLLARSITHSIKHKCTERQLRRINEALKAEIDERRRVEDALRLDEMRLEALWRLSQMSEDSDEEIADFVLDQQIRLTGSKCGLLSIVKEDLTAFTIYGPRGTFKDCHEGARFFGAVVTRQLSGGAEGMSRPVIINDFKAEQGDARPGYSPTRALFVPVAEGGRTVAFVALADRETEYNEGNIIQVSLLLAGMWRLVQRHRADKALREAENSLRLMADSLPALVTYIDANLRYKFVNRAHEKYGVSPDRIIGARMDEILGPRDYELVRPHVETALQGRQTQFELEAGVDHAKRSFSIWYVPNLDETGGVLGFFALAHDITERKRDETEAQRRRDELAHVARVATMGELSSSLAHELGQPLTGIMGNVQAALRFMDRPTPDLDEVKSALDDILDDCRRAGAVIGKLRSILKKKGFEKTVVDVNDLVRETLKLVASEAIRKKVCIEADPCAGLPSVMGDHVQLQQVLINLVLNGFDSMAKAPVDTRRLKILTSSEGETVTVKVSDSGPGVDLENMKCIFEPFYTTKVEGIGMGLPISRYIIESHHGKLWAERNSTCGMTFSFSLSAGDKQ